MDQESPEEYLTFHEFLAQWVGSAKTLRRRLKDGSIPKYQPGGPGTLLAIPRSALTISTSTRPKEDPKQPGNQSESKEVHIPGPKPKWRKNHAD